MASGLAVLERHFAVVDEGHGRLHRRDRHEYCFFGIGLLGTAQTAGRHGDGLGDLFDLAHPVNDGHPAKRIEGGLPFGIMDILIVAALAKGIRGGLKAEKIKKEKGWDWNTTSK